MKALLLVGVLAVAPIAARAEHVKAPDAPAFMTGAKLWQLCTDPQSNLQACMGFVTGIADTMSTEEVRGFSACLPANVTVAMATARVTIHLGGHSLRELSSIAAVPYVAEALSLAYPCKRT